MFRCAEMSKDRGGIGNPSSTPKNRIVLELLCKIEVVLQTLSDKSSNCKI